MTFLIPSPYTVVALDEDGHEVTEHVLAYGIMEAMTAASIRAHARGCPIVKILDAQPDLDAFRAQFTRGSSEMLALLRAADQRRPQ